MKSINNILINSLNIKQEETKKFTLLFFHSFFTGLFIALYFVQANTVFINNYGSEQLPIAYMLAGVVGWLSSSIYSSLQKRIHSKHLFGGALLFMFMITIIGRFALGYIEEKYLSFFVFIWAWPFISIVGIESGGLAIKLLNLTQIKRLFGLINMGGVTASIIGYLIIPVLTKIIGTSYNLFIIAATSLLAAMLLLYFIYKNFPEKEITIKQSKDKAKTNFKYLLKDKYFRLIFISATLSMTVIYIADFGFLSSIKIQKELFADSDSVAHFLALVFAGMKVGELIMSYFSSRILSKYGVKLGLTILPLSITLIVIISTITGFTIGAVSVIFLILMTLNKAAERILRRGLDDPASNILYQPLPENMQLVVQSKVGVVMQFSIGIAGIILFLINIILNSKDGFKLEFFTLFFIPILLVWVYFAWKLYLAYKVKLRDMLKELSKKRQRDTSKYHYGTEVLSKKFKDVNENIVNLSVVILSETNPRIFEPHVASLLRKNDPLIKKAVLRNIDPTWRERITRYTKKIYKETNSLEIKKIAEKVNYLLDFSETKNITKDIIEVLMNSNDIDDKVKLIKYLIKKKTDVNDEIILLHLLKQKDKIIKNAAIRLSVNIKTDKIIKKLIFLLCSPEFYHTSTAAILDIGERTLPYLEELFESTKENDIILKIIEIYAKMGSTPAKSLLASAINYPDRKVQLSAIWALYYCKYQAVESEHDIIKKKILDVTENLLWILATIKDIEEEKNTLKLFLALDQEKVNNHELLFNLLSFLHDPRVVNLIKKNIIGKNTIYALELIDNFIIPDLKPYIIPIFEDISVAQRIKKLAKFFPQEKMKFMQRLRAIVLRDFDKLDKWTIAKALEMMGKVQRKRNIANKLIRKHISYDDITIWKKENTNLVLNQIKRSELPDEVFLALFHKNELVYSTAAKIIYDENPDKCINYLEKMSEEKKNLIKIFTEGGFLLQDKIRLLRRYQLFFTLPDYLLIRIAELVKPNILERGKKIYFSENGSENILILIRGILIYKKGLSDEHIFKKKIIVTPGMNIEQNAEYLTAVKKTTVLAINRYKYFNLLVDKTEILQQIFDVIKK